MPKIHPTSVDAGAAVHTVTAHPAADLKVLGTVIGVGVVLAVLRRRRRPTS
jgi:hypothetical protein